MLRTLFDNCRWFRNTLTRSTGLPADQRLCSLCTTTEPEIEDETHFPFNCKLYNELRQHNFSD